MDYIDICNVQYAPVHLTRPQWPHRNHHQSRLAFDEVVVAVSNNRQRPTGSASQERMDMITETVGPSKASP